MKNNSKNSSKEKIEGKEKNPSKSKAKKNKKDGWDTTSKVIIGIAVFVLAVIIVFFTVRGKKDVIVDDYGKTHIVVTNFWGEYVQDEYGMLYEKVTDDQGEEITTGYIFPDRIYNEKSTKVENAFIKLKIRKGWNDFSTDSYLGMQHTDCSGEAKCEVKINYDIMASSYTLYEKEKSILRADVEMLSNYFSDFNEYETEIFGLKARAMSVKQKLSDGNTGSWYYYLVEQGLAAFEIRIFIEDDCYTEAEIIKETEKAFELKNLGGVRQDVPSTEAASEEETTVEEESTEPSSETPASDVQTNSSAE